MRAIRPVSAAVCSMIGSSSGSVCAGELKSKINGIGSETSGGRAVDLFPFTARNGGLRPMSTEVLMYSRP